MLNFYVYQYVDPRSSLPFYIGKGKDDRMNYHINNVRSRIFKNRLFQNILIKMLDAGIQPIIEKIKDNLNEHEALELEKELISKYGRRLYDANGILCNLTLGGEGVTGVKHSNAAKEKMSAYHKNRSEEHKQRISKALKGRKHSQQTIEQMKARIITNDTKQKLSDSLKGKKKSEKHCQAIKEAQSGEKCPLLS